MPQGARIKWLFSGIEGRAFEAWWRDALSDGASWFECPLETPMGYQNYTCRFTDVYQGPARVGPDLWAFSAELELRERAVMPPGWGDLPDYILQASIIDIALNLKWPEYVPGKILTQGGDRILTENGEPLILE